jgi:hypothetical protein
MKKEDLIGTKPSIYMGAPLAGVMVDRITGTRNMSQTMAGIGERYSEIIRRNMPTLTVAEWSLLCAVVRKWEPSNTSIAHMSSAIEDALHWSDDQDLMRSLADKSREWVFEMKLAVVDTCERLDVVRRRSKGTVEGSLRTLGVRVL